MENSLTQPFNPLGQVADDQIYKAVVLRSQVKGIVDSYHHAFDAFLEAIQNAVDACEERFSKESDGEYSPQIKITIDLKRNSLSVFDNGIGMSLEDITQFFFTPFATRKSHRKDSLSDRLRGEKGVGTTFLAYSSNDFRVTTQNSNGQLISAQLGGGREWVYSDAHAEQMPMVQPAEPLAFTEQGTGVYIEISDESPAGLLHNHGKTGPQWEAILRLYTAVGFVEFSDSDAFLSLLKVDIELINKGDGPDSEHHVVKTGFLYPHRMVDSAVRKSQLSRNKRGELAVGQRNQDVLYEFFSAPQVSEKMATRLGKAYTRDAGMCQSI